MYINDIANINNVKKIKKILNSIDTDAILNSTDLYNYFSNKSIFPLLLETGSPEIVSSNLYNGKIAILIDQVPIALMLPISLFSLITFDEGKKSPLFQTIYSRIFTIIMLFLSIFFLPA